MRKPYRMPSRANSGRLKRGACSTIAIGSIKRSAMQTFLNMPRMTRRAPASTLSTLGFSSRASWGTNSGKRLIGPDASEGKKIAKIPKWTGLRIGSRP